MSQNQLTRKLEHLNNTPQKDLTRRRNRHSQPITQQWEKLGQIETRRGKK